MARHQRAHRLADSERLRLTAGPSRAWRAIFANSRDSGINLRYLDFGGGLGVRYSNEKPFSAADYAKTIAGILRPLRLPSAARAGPFDRRSAGVLLMRVLYTKRIAARLSSLWMRR